MLVGRIVRDPEVKAIGEGKHISTLACIIKQANEINTMVNTH